MKIITKNAKVFGVLLLIVTIIVVIGLAIRFFQIAGTKQVDGHNLTSATRAAFIQNQQDPATRGKIFDTNGKVLADNTTTYNLYAVLDKTQKQGNKPLYVVDKEETAEKLSRIINMKRSKIYKILSQKNLKQVEFGTAGKNLSIAVHKKIEDLKLSGISFTAQPARTYPNGRMASHLIGSVQSKENATTGQTKLSGLMGIEAAENSLLSGKDGIKSYAGTTADGQASEAAKNGDNVYLTLNSDLQNTLETKMDKLFSDTKPSGIVAVLAEAKTGRVLAASQRPNFDPNTKKGLQDEWQNLLTQGAFEPGSTMKGITLASAIETGNWQPNATFQSGTMLVDGKQINDFNKEMGVISYREGFWRSSNIAFAKTQQKMGANTWYKYLKKFKFLQSTNSGLLGEEKGSIAFNYPLEQANTAFGQGISVTPLQMVQAYSAIANDGKEVKPYFVDKISEADTGKVVKEGKTEVVANPIKKSTAQAVRKEMIDVVNQKTGTAREFDLRDAGYQVAAKTGTAQIAKNGRYLDGLSNAIHSVVVLAPEKDPQYIFYMAITAPQKFVDTEIQVTMNKLYRPLMLQALNSSTKAVKSKTTKVTVPDTVGKSIDSAKHTLSNRGLRVAMIGSSGKIKAQSLNPNQQALSNQLIILTAKDGNTLMPNMTGWSLTEVQEFAKMANINLNWTGSGYVTSQNVSATQQLGKWSNITVKLKQKE